MGWGRDDGAGVRRREIEGVGREFGDGINGRNPETKDGLSGNCGGNGASAGTRAAGGKSETREQPGTIAGPVSSRFGSLPQSRAVNARIGGRSSFCDAIQTG